MADAIQQFEGWRPGSRSYQNRNPGNLRLADYPADDRGYTIFVDYVRVHNSAARTEIEFTGANTHKIGPESTLQQLMNVYAPPADNNPATAYAHYVADWVGKALVKPITTSTALKEIWKCNI